MQIATKINHIQKGSVLMMKIWIKELSGKKDRLSFNVNQIALNKKKLWHKIVQKLVKLHVLELGQRSSFHGDVYKAKSYTLQSISSKWLWILGQRDLQSLDYHEIINTDPNRLIKTIVPFWKLQCFTVSYEHT